MAPADRDYEEGHYPIWPRDKDTCIARIFGEHGVVLGISRDMVEEDVLKEQSACSGYYCHLEWFTSKVIDEKIELVWK